jgi:hypothetical protein
LFWEGDWLIKEDRRKVSKDPLLFTSRNLTTRKDLSTTRINPAGEGNFDCLQDYMLGCPKNVFHSKAIMLTYFNHHKLQEGEKVVQGVKHD